MIKTKEFGNAGIINGYEICIASANEPDCSLAMHYGEKGENYIEISIYDNNSILFEKVKIDLTRDVMLRILAGFRKAEAISRAKIMKELEV